MRLVVLVPQSMREQLVAEAERRGTTVADLARGALEGLLEAQGKK